MRSKLWWFVLTVWGVLVVITLAAMLCLWLDYDSPAAVSDGAGTGAGSRQAGESPLTVSGSWAQIATVARAEQTPPATEAAREPEERTGQTYKTREETNMDNMQLVMAGYFAGVGAVLLGAFMGPLVAGLWRKIRDRRD